MDALVNKPDCSSQPVPHAKLSRFVWQSFVRSPLWMCLLVGVLARVFLIIHTHGVVAGDEAVTGMQAEYILRGAHPVYYYGQAYMGSLEAYIIAFVFLLVGPSVLTLRIAMTLISLSLVPLTWFFAAALADEARVSWWVKRRFMLIATLVAALPPLYDAVLELRSFGGYTEAMIIMLWLLLAALRFTQRWQMGATKIELSVRWLGIGFLLGLGFWIDPLVVYAVATIALWLGWFFLARLVAPQHGGVATTRLALLKEVSLACVTLPAVLIGAAPALYWGYHHKWENIAYAFHNGGSGTVRGDGLATIYKVQALYTACIAPRVIGGTLPTEPFVTQDHPHILTSGLVITGLCLLFVVGGITLSLFWKHPTLVHIRQMTLLPLIFCTCTSIIYCVSSISVASLYANCGPWDLTGRYVVPLIIATPYFLAAVIALSCPSTKNVFKVPAPVDQSVSSWNDIVQSAKSRTVRSVMLVAVLLLYFSTQAYAYVQSSPYNTFKTSGCVSAPDNDAPIIAYLQQQHVRYALATAWIGDPLTFKTNIQLLVTEIKSRIPDKSALVLQSKGYSLIMFAKHDDPQPPILRALQQKHIYYKVKRFVSVPGRDIIVITPLDQTIPIRDPVIASALQPLHDQC